MRDMLTAWRSMAGKMALAALARRQKTAQAIAAYRDATRVGLLIPLREHDDLQWIDSLCKSLSEDGKLCDLLCFSVLPMGIPTDHNVVIMGPEDLRWNLIPKEDAIKSFISTNFDLLLNLCADDSCLPLDYSAIKANASLRIGRYEPAFAHAYGVMVKGHFTDSKGLLKAMKHYLSKIQ